MSKIEFKKKKKRRRKKVIRKEKKKTGEHRIIKLNKNSRGGICMRVCRVIRIIDQ